jgi:hypothetical protein
VIKFNINRIITAQGFNRDEIFEQVGRNENVAEKNRGG